MKVYEIITELSFYGRTCTKDCSGHRAGWNWARRKNVDNDTDCASSSNSFSGGCEVHVSQQAQGIRPIGPAVRGEGGRFTKFKEEPRQSKKRFK